MKADLAAQGLAPRSNLVADVSRMRFQLEQAKAKAGRGDFAGAREALQVVEALTARVSKEYGR
jgi:hypothetical protein